MLAIVMGIGYLLIHFAIYALVLRHIPALRSERAIFLVHFASFWALTAAVFLLVLPSGVGEALTVTAAVAALHGIYSLSFLELWSLTEGSYSFRVLAAVESGAVVEAEHIARNLGRIGDEKKALRVDSLRRLGLIRQDSDMLKLTTRGKYVALFLRALQRLTNLRNTG